MDNWFKKTFSSPMINFLGERKCKSHFTEPPILIGGCGRSGTTLLLAILSAHPEIFAIPYETDAFTDWHQPYDQLQPKRLDRFHLAVLTHRIPATATRWCEKRPANIHSVDKILTYFGEETKFIQIVRDPRAVCTSYHPLDEHNYWVSPERYALDVNAGLKFLNHPQVFTLKYEDLISDFSAQVQTLIKFLNVSMMPEPNRWFDQATVRTNKAWGNALTDIHGESVDKWRSPSHKARVEELMTDAEILRLMEHFQYI